jgi:hypothetical protein
MERQKISIYKDQMSEYKRQITEWGKELRYFKRAINVMLNDTDIRMDMIEFIKNFTHDQIRQVLNTSIISHIQNIENYDEKMSYTIMTMKSMNNIDQIKLNIIQYLNENPEIILEHRMINTLKRNFNHIAFWITQYRDHQIERLVKCKPIKLGLIEPYDPYTVLVMDYKCLTRRMVDSNVKLGVVHIQFPNKSQVGLIDDVGFYDKNGNFRILHRMVGDDQGPYCI